ncbi:hypothetical protein CDO73_17295 [Saccharibacillus sp. O23]|uniref:hypothetical protein n=1 Tax=Saccharibacillus sp. O23 TaxID=2009338 RepID=UPI000B4E28C3|nr:hypothetical protein [Saccharibacillus sp. O23]OWR28658.1 hypothetical protein CDO73_17295 [Saccharibacillus sp. O23]
MTKQNLRPRSGEPASERLDWLPPVDYPTETEQRRQIGRIVQIALPKRLSFPAYVTEMYRQVGFRHLFRDLTEIVFVLLLGIGVWIFTALFAMEQRNTELAYGFIFMVSPLLYLAISALFFAELRRSDTYAVEMACRYNVYQLASLRMLAFAAVCLVLNAALVCWLSLAYGSVDAPRGLLLSASSLMLFAAAFLYGLLRGRSTAARYGWVALWPVLNLILGIAAPRIYGLLMIQLPLYVYAVMFALGGWLYFRQIRRLIAIRPGRSV